MIVYPAVLIAAYLLGSLPWSLWVGRAHGVDLRTQGSGNLGATNVYRVLGARWGIAVLLLDIAKGTGAVLLARALSPESAAGVLPAAAGLAAVAGHMFTPFAGFRGGKGVATGLGIFIGLAPLSALFAFLVWAAALVLTGWVSVASGIAALFLPLFVLLMRDQLGMRFPWVMGLALITTVLVLVRHRGNWRRVAEGREQAIWEKRAESPESGAAPRGAAQTEPRGSAAPPKGASTPKGGAR